MHRVAVTAFGVLICLSAPVQAELVVNISKSQQRLSVTIDGAEAYRWPISTGVRRYDTPKGIFRPQRLERHWYSRQYSLTPMPWAMFFHRGYAVHGTMEAYNLGRAASHGCVRLRPDNAATLYSMVRRQGLAQTKFVVLDGPLPDMTPAPAPLTPLPPHRPPVGIAEMSAAGADHFARADAGDTEELASKRAVAVKADTGLVEIDRKIRARVRVADTEAVRFRTSVGSDEARVLREREAWLRGLDRKYGITR